MFNRTYPVKPQSPVYEYMRRLGFALGNQMSDSLKPGEVVRELQIDDHTYLSIAERPREELQIWGPPSRVLFEIKNMGKRLVVKQRSARLTQENIDAAVADAQALLRGEQEPTQESVEQVH